MFMFTTSFTAVAPALASTGASAQQPINKCDMFGEDSSMDDTESASTSTSTSQMLSAPRRVSINNAQDPQVTTGNTRGANGSERDMITGAWSAGMDRGIGWRHSIDREGQDVREARKRSANQRQFVFRTDGHEP